MAAGDRAGGHRRSVLLVGGVVTLLVVGLDQLRLLDALEHRTIDLRFEHASPTRELDAHVAFVDVDDSTLHAFGRWPWPREKIALALREVARAGPRTVALDLLLDEPEEATTRGATAPGDEQLAAAIGAAPTALAIDLGDEDPRESTREFDADAAKRSHFELEATRLLLELERRDGRAPSAETLSAELAKATTAASDAALVDEVVASVLRADDAWRAVAPCLLASSRTTPSTGATSSDALAFSKPPLLVLAKSGRAAGFVNFEHDDDGGLRWVPVARAGRGGATLQLGVAAALLDEGVTLDQVSVDADALRVGSGGSVREWRLDRGRLWLVWPRANAGDASTTPAWRVATPNRCTFGFALNVALVDADLEWNRTRRRELAAEIRTNYLKSLVQNGEELVEPVRKETEFRLADDVPGSKLTPEEEAELAPFREFRKLDRVVATEEQTLAESRARLADALRGRLVFVGWTATGAASDFVPTPLGTRTPGVVAHAVAADMVRNGRSLRFTPPFTGLLLTLLLGLVATETCLLPVAGSLATLLALLAAHAGVAAWLFARHLVVLPIAAPVVGASAAWVATIALRSALAQLDQRRITRQFKARVGPELVDFLVDHPDALSRTGEPREVTAFFSDLAGFTSLSEQLGAQETVALLNRCMSATTNALVANGAYVNKFLGDGLMAFWSAFRIDPEQATHACRGALAAQRELAKVVDATRVQARMGLATGRAIVGDCGAPPLLHDYTAIGDVVNLASRLETANKQFGTNVLVDGRTRELVTDPALRFRSCGRVVVVGQTNAVDLFELVTRELPDELVALSDRAIAAFRSLHLEESDQLFRELESRFGPSGLAAVHRRAIAKALASPEARARFDGVLWLEAK
jgi:class 3 adenylate cyclase